MSKKDIVSAMIIDDSDSEIDSDYDVNKNNVVDKLDVYEKERLLKEEIKELKKKIKEIEGILKTETKTESKTKAKAESKTKAKAESKTKAKAESKTVSKKQEPLKIAFDLNSDIIEIGIDEAGRGPMFGRVYAGVVVLSKYDTFDHSLMKDSKKFTSKKKIEEAAEYIKENAIAWAVEYEDENVIDDINILQATQSAMHKAIKKVLTQLKGNINKNISYEDILLLVDGNYFKPYSMLNETKTKLVNIKHYTVEGGDNKYTSIAAASILAKVERDKYIEQLCNENPELITNYGIDSNKGYGSKKHMEGIKTHGITKWHRKTFGICRDYC